MLQTTDMHVVFFLSFICSFYTPEGQFHSHPTPNLLDISPSSAASLVGSYVWSHLTNLLRSEDPLKQSLIESLPEDIVSRDFESEFLKYSSYSDHTVSSGNGVAQARL